jgi:type I restriction enzyme S subunit
MAAAFNDTPIENLCKRVTAGSTPLRSRADFYDGGTIDWYKTGELTDWYLGPADERITAKALEETSVKLFPTNTVLMAMYGDGKTITSMGMLRSPAATNQACSAMLVDEKKCDPRYFFYALKGRRDLLLKVASGGAQRNLSGKLIKEFRLPVPPVPVQHRIAGILSAYDELIENSQRRIKILEAMARALYREWFVHFRFPGHENHPRIASPLGEIPQGWEVKKLGEIAEDMRRNVPKGQLEEPRPFVGLEHIPRRSLALDAWETATKLGSNKLEFKKGEVLFGKIRPYFHKVSVAPFDGLCSADTIVIRARRPEHYACLVACVSSDAFVAEASATANGAKMPRANWDVLKKYPVVIPKGEVADKFSALFADVIAQQQTLIFHIQNLRRTRDLLLPRLLSGQIDVGAIPEGIAA